ncbi:hypothetical protein FIBSPDRAFT_870841, partial [Athelia psychrophila]
MNIPIYHAAETHVIWVTSTRFYSDTEPVNWDTFQIMFARFAEPVKPVILCLPPGKQVVVIGEPVVAPVLLG